MRSVVLVTAVTSACGPPLACLGDEGLCDRRLDEITLAMTHNAMSSADEDWWLPNQTHAVPRQLEDGIRGFMLDTYDQDGVAVLCHGYCQLGQSDLAAVLGSYTTFLEGHPGEILWFVLQDAASVETTVAAFDAAGLTPYAATLPTDGPLPTLRELVAAGTPLVVTTEGDRSDEAPSWYQPAYRVAWDNPYSAKTVDDFSCDTLRGSRDNPLFLLNHFLTNPVALRSLAELANPTEVIAEHAERCEAETGDRVNAIAVDFYDVGGVLDVVRALNDRTE